MKKIFLSFVAAAIGLTACSSENSKVQFGQKIPSILRELKFKKAPSAAAGNPFAGLTRAQLKDVKGPLLAAHLEISGAYSALNLAASNGGVRTYFTPDQISVSILDGVVISTRGLPEDLMSADATLAVEAVLNAKVAPRYERQYRWIDGEDHQVEGQFECSLEFVDLANVVIVERTHRARHMKEICSGSVGTVTNDYWVGTGEPVVWQSRQWIGPELGHINLTVLIAEKS